MGAIQRRHVTRTCWDWAAFAYNNDVIVSFVSVIGFICYDSMGTELTDAMLLLISAVDRKRRGDEFELCQTELVIIG